MNTRNLIPRIIRRKSAAEPVQVPYVDEKRDHRDLVIITAISTALEIVRHDDNDAADILQLALWQMQSSWPVTEDKFCGEVDQDSFRALADRARAIVGEV
jgi:hypothetical protein